MARESEWRHWRGECGLVRVVARVGLGERFGIPLTAVLLLLLLLLRRCVCVCVCATAVCSVGAPFFDDVAWPALSGLVCSEHFDGRTSHAAPQLHS